MNHSSVWCWFACACGAESPQAEEPRGQGDGQRGEARAEQMAVAAGWRKTHGRWWCPKCMSEVASVNSQRC